MRELEEGGGWVELGSGGVRDGRMEEVVSRRAWGAGRCVGGVCSGEQGR